jgi:hypothetical protein
LITRRQIEGNKEVIIILKMKDESRCMKRRRKDVVVEEIDGWLIRIKVRGDYGH